MLPSRVVLLKEALNKNPADIDKNTINFLNALSQDDLRTMGIKYRITVITWIMKVVGKHEHVDTVQDKIDIMQHPINVLKGLFVSLFQNGFPYFWEEGGRIFSQLEYQDMLVKCRLHHKKFKDMNHSLSRKIMVEKLALDFEIINTSRAVCTQLP